MKKRSFLILCFISIIILIILLSILYSELSREPPLNIGFIGPLTGKYGDLGVQARNGVLLAVNYVNSKGGIKGRHLKLIAEDSSGTPQGSINAFKKLSKSNVKAIIGPMLSTSAMAIKPFLKENCIPIISPTVTTSELSKKKDCFFKMMNDNTIEAYGIASYAIKLLDKKVKHPRRWCVIYDLGNPDYTLDLLEHFKKTIRKLSNRDFISFQIGYLAGKKRVPYMVFEQLDSLSFHALLLITSAIDGAQIINWISRKMPDVLIFGSTWIASNELLKRLRPDHIPVYVMQQFPSKPTLKIRDFTVLYEQNYGCSPNYPALISYETLMLIYKALKRSELNKEPLVEIIPTIKEYFNLFMPLNMDKYGDVHRPYWIEVIKQRKSYSIEKIEDAF